MFSHMTVGASDMIRAAAFYDAFLAPLGIIRFWEDGKGCITGWRQGSEGSHFFVCTPFDGKPAMPGNGWMCAFNAPNRQAVIQAYDAALAHGGTDEGPPGLRPQYSPHYFGAYVRDPDGNKLHVVYRGSSEA
jgi:catechol 2,3-dioxygenase-like lactoylglutathione lyase family enzyme